METKSTLKTYLTNREPYKVMRNAAKHIVTLSNDFVFSVDCRYKKISEHVC